MCRHTPLIVAKSFKISPKEVKELSHEKIIKLSKAKLIFEEDHTDRVPSSIRVIHNNIKSQPGEYNVTLGATNSRGEVETCEIEVTVKNRKNFFLLLLTLLALIALAGGLWWYNSRPNIVASGLPTATTEKMSPVALKKYAQKAVDQSNVTVQVYPHIYIKGDGQNGKMYVQNIPVNKTGQVATLKDKTTGEVLYTSELLKPGYQVSKVNLKKKLSKGDHQGLVTLTFYDLKEEKQVGKANVAVTIHVGDKAS